MRKINQILLVTFSLMLLSLAALAQNVITGKVTDSKDGTPVSGVTVSVKGTRTAVQTTADGTFRINAPAGSTLVFTSVGFGTQEMNTTGRTAFDISLAQSNQQLNEVVVVGYGTVRKKDLTGAVTVIGTKDFAKGVITSPEQLIAGKVAGVSITSNGGAPGSGSTIRIRGGASLNASNDPLIVIDGVPLENSGIAGAPNALTLINPNDIETFNVLKDASATAIYGSRASNGVIIITTKRGKSGKVQFNFNTQVSVATKSKTVDVLTADELRAYVNTYGNTAQKNLLGTANTDWQDEIYHTAIGTDNNLSASGAFKNIPFRASVGYLNQNGILRTGNLQRTSVGLNISPKLFNNSLKIDLNLKGSFSKSRYANEGAIGAAASFDPTQPVRVNSPRYGGYYEWLDPTTDKGLRALAPLNPVGLLEQNYNTGNVQRSIGNLVLDYTLPFFKDLRANFNVGYDVSKGKGVTQINDSAASNYRRFKDGSNVFHGGVDNEYLQKRESKLMEFYLGYAKELPGVKSRVDLIAGYSYQNFKTTNYFFNDVTTDGTVVTTPTFQSETPENTLISVYGRLNYGFKNRYLLTASVRRDGSSRFIKSNRWGTFPSGALAWRIKEENFLRSNKTVSDLKLRIGYGITGQQDGIGLYDYTSFYYLSESTAQYQLGNTFYQLNRPSGYYERRKWEQTATTNIGLDYGFLNNRITGSIEVYYKKTTDLLNEIDQPAGTNFSNKIVANVGSMENKGIEFSINADIIRKKDLTWSFGFNATYNKNEITKLTISSNPEYPGVPIMGISGGTGQTIGINSVGFNRGSFYVYKQVYDPATGKPIDGLFEDLNRDGIINEKDRYRYKSIDPKGIFGFSTNVIYKKWNAGTVLRANLGNYVYNNVNSNIGTKAAIFGTGYLNNAYSDVLNTNISGAAAGYSLSDYYVQNASFLRMDNINLGYDFGSVINKKAHLRLNFNVNNVFVVTKYKGLDPEIGSGLDNNFYPRPRTFVLGANLDF